MNRLKKYDSTENLCFSLYPTTVKSLRSLCGEWGSIGRAIQVAVEIMVERIYNPRPDRPALEGSGLSSAEERTRELKIPLSFKVLPITKEQIEWLSHAERYKNRNEVISACEGVLSDLSERHSLRSKVTPKKR
jgi:hypothetical protein